MADSVRIGDLQTYGSSDGVSGIEPLRRERSLVTDTSGKVWISLSHGISSGDPKLPDRDSALIQVRIDSVSANGKSIALSERFRVPSGSGSMTFHYSSDSLLAPERVRFRYRLQGAEAGWSDAVAERQVLYNNLGPGDYRFHVIPSRDGGLWNSPETVYSFSIDPSYWQTWWFRTAAVVAILLGVLLIMRLRSGRLACQLTAQFQERLSERTRIAQELHDTLLQSFQGLMLRFQSVDNLLPSRPAEAKGILDDALERADDALTESRAAIQNIRSGSAQNPNLAQAITSMMAEMAEECAARGNHQPEYSVLVEGTPKRLSPWISSEVRRIANESVRNSFQHAQATQIEAEVTFSESHLRIRFRDNGVGIDPAVLSNGARSGHWGLIGMKERARHIGAKLDVWSKPGAGTELDLSVPGRLAYDESRATAGLRLFRRRSKRDYEQQP